MSDLAGTKGGSGVWQRIISEMPPHDVYVEAFWGRGTIARKKKPASITIGIDLDPDAISHGSGSAMMFQADAIRWLTDYFQPGVVAGSGGEALVAGSSVAGNDAECHGGTLRNQPSRIATFGGVSWDKHFVYLDPPYLGCRNYYKHEFGEAQHRELCRLFRALPCPAALSGYASQTYAEELAGVRFIKIPTVNRAGKKCVEYLWLNYERPSVLHDARFVGRDRRERERIQRRVRNWREQFAKMPAEERQAIFEALAAVYGDPSWCRLEARHIQEPITRR